MGASTELTYTMTQHGPLLQRTPRTPAWTPDQAMQRRMCNNQFTILAGQEGTSATTDEAVQSQHVPSEAGLRAVVEGHLLQRLEEQIIQERRFQNKANPLYRIETLKPRQRTEQGSTRADGEALTPAPTMTMSDHLPPASEWTVVTRKKKSRGPKAGH